MERRLVYDTCVNWNGTALDVEFWKEGNVYKMRLGAPLHSLFSFDLDEMLGILKRLETGEVS